MLSDLPLESMLALIRAEIAKSEAELSATELNEHLLPFHVFELAKLSLFDENQSLDEKLYQLRNSAFISATLALASEFSRRNLESNYIFVSYGFLCCEAFWLFAIALYVYFYRELRKCNIHARLAAAREQLQVNEHCFEARDGKLLIFNNYITKRSLQFDCNTKRFGVNKPANSTAQRTTYPEYNIDGSNVKLPLFSLNLIYTPPDQSHFAGTFAGINIITDGSTDFSGHLIFVNDEILTVPEYPNSFLRQKFKLGLHKVITNLMRLKASCGKVPQSRDIELAIIEALYNVTLQLFQQERAIANCERTIDPKLNIIKTLDISKFTGEGGGVCRHRSLTLAKLINYAQDLGIVQGELRFRCATSIIGHAWLEYRAKDHNKEDASDYYFIDPMNRIFKHRNAKEMFFQKGNDELIAKFESYARISTYPTSQKLKLS